MFGEFVELGVGMGRAGQGETPARCPAQRMNGLYFAARCPALPAKSPNHFGLGKGGLGRVGFLAQVITSYLVHL